ncbi:MAG: hypothetical protein AABX55_00460 [Nanoarchaeota archaeon]
MAKTYSKTRAPDELIQLNINLQNKAIQLMEAMNNLSKRIDRLVNLFEEASKHLSEVEDDTRVKELATKLEELLEQNKNLAHGLLLLEKYVRQKQRI